MSQPKRVVIIAGEESGDRYGAELAHHLQAWNNTLIISGIGGQHMQQAGVNLVSDLARFGVTGFTEVLRHFLIIRRAFKLIKTHLAQHKPDLLILIDYPGFNLRLAKIAKQLGIRIVYYISPQIWAWKAGRINTIQACIDRMAVILPFEKKLYQQAGVSVDFVGHPLVSKIPNYPDLDELRDRLNLPADATIIALLPGSRRNEIAQHMPILVKAAKLLAQENPALHFVVPVACTIDPQIINNYFAKQPVSVSIINGQALEVAACSDCVVVASGTASLECALLEKPMCIIYKASFLTYFMATKLIKVKYLGLCNLLKNKMIVPELLQYDCNAQEIARMIKRLLKDKVASTTMTNQLKNLKQELSAAQADISISELIKQEL